MSLTGCGGLQALEVNAVPWWAPIVGAIAAAIISGCFLLVSVFMGNLHRDQLERRREREKGGAGSSSGFGVVLLALVLVLLGFWGLAHGDSATGTPAGPPSVAPSKAKPKSSSSAKPVSTKKKVNQFTEDLREVVNESAGRPEPRRLHNFFDFKLKWNHAVFTDEQLAQEFAGTGGKYVYLPAEYVKTCKTDGPKRLVVEVRVPYRLKWQPSSARQFEHVRYTLREIENGPQPYHITRIESGSC